MRKLYLFSNTPPNNNKWYHCYSMADSGHVLAEHICSHPHFMPGDLFFNNKERQEKCEKHFGGPLNEVFEVVILKVGEVPPKDVINKNIELGKAGRAPEDERAGATIQFSDGTTREV